MRLVIAVLMLVGFAAPTRANDSVAEIAVGGLTLRETDAISLDSEDLHISKAEVRVNYKFTNTSDKNIEVLVAFPLPDQVYDENGEGYFHDMKKELDFQTRVDGQPVSYDVVEQAFSQGVDVTKRIAALGLPLNGTEDAQAFDATVRALAETDRKGLITDGLVANQAAEDDLFYAPIWNLRTTITRRQMFPAHKTVAVQHRYKPLVGGSVGGNLNAEFRNDDWSKQHARRYCIEDSWFKALDAALAKKGTAAFPSPYNEWWVAYVLSTGANWKGPIKEFRLVVDKGKPDNLVSFCAAGVTKISPTQFEVKKSNFEPKDDLNILIVEWFEPDEGQ